jgi:hypothetical protein
MYFAVYFLLCCSLPRCSAADQSWEKGNHLFAVAGQMASSMARRSTFWPDFAPLLMLAISFWPGACAAADVLWLANLECGQEREMSIINGGGLKRSGIFRVWKGDKK